MTDTTTTQAMASTIPRTASPRHIRVTPIFLALGFGLVLAVAAAVVLIALRATDAERLVEHTYEGRLVARDLLSELQDAETGQRGFLLTGQENYLGPYDRATTSVYGRIDNLDKLSSGNPGQLPRLNALRLLVGEKLDELRTTVTLTREGQRDQALAIVNSNRGKEIMDDIRTQLAAFSQAELDLLTLRESDTESLRRWLLVLIIFSLSAAVALAGFLARSTQFYVERLEERTVELETEAKHRREAEDTLRQAHKMEAVGQLTGGIAHDFNNLLTIISGNLDTLRRRLAGVSPAQDAKELAASLAKPLDFALQGSRSAAQLTHRLLAFSRRQTLEPIQLDLNRLISGMSDLLRRTLGETTEMEVVLAAGLWVTFADANQLENALLNLCVNARDAMPNGGRLTIETANTYLDDAYAKRFGDIAPGQYVQLSVTDTGTGIPAGVIERVFEPFFTTKAVGDGSGLGLAMVHGFVKQSGGHVRIYSELGHGTTMKIYLPRLTQTAEGVAAPAANVMSALPLQLAQASETVLVVEDNDGVRDYAKTVLEELGYSVHEARDAKEALLALDGAMRVDVLFTDVVLPGGMNGRELASRVSVLRPGLPVLFTTGYTRNAIVHGGRLDANVHLLSKPYTQQDLALKIRESIDGKKND